MGFLRPPTRLERRAKDSEVKEGAEEEGGGMGDSMSSSYWRLNCVLWVIVAK